MIREVKLGQVRRTPELMFDLVLSFKRLVPKAVEPAPVPVWDGWSTFPSRYAPSTALCL